MISSQPNPLIGRPREKERNANIVQPAPLTRSGHTQKR